jgi:hypothetical protein
MIGISMDHYHEVEMKDIELQPESQVVDRRKPNPRHWPILNGCNLFFCIFYRKKNEFDSILQYTEFLKHYK